MQKLVPRFLSTISDCDSAQKFLACSERCLDSVSIRIDPDFAAKSSTLVEKDEKIVTAGGHLIASSAVAPTLEQTV